MEPQSRDAQLDSSGPAQTRQDSCPTTLESGPPGRNDCPVLNMDDELSMPLPEDVSEARNSHIQKAILLDSMVTGHVEKSNNEQASKTYAVLAEAWQTNQALVIKFVSPLTS